MDQLTLAIRGLTARIIGQRFKLENERKQRNLAMPLEIKGLKGKALKAGGVFDRLNLAYDKLIETGSAHATDVEGLPAQIEGMADDLTFMVQTLGNSVNGSGETEKPADKPKEKQVIGSGEVGSAADVLPPVTDGLPEVDPESAYPFRGA